MHPDPTANFDAHTYIYDRSPSPFETEHQPLAGALSVHHPSSVGRSPSGDDGYQATPKNFDNQSKSIFYDLRPSARNGRTAFVTWLDTDDSGNYDPSIQTAYERGRSKQRRLLQPHRHQMPANTAKDEEEKDDIVNRTVQLSVLAARQRGCSMVVSLKLERSETIALMQKIPENWPGMYHNVLSDEYLEQQVREILQNPSSPWGSYNLRDRSDLNFAEQSRSSTANAYLSDPAGIENDLTNHPTARGCVGCRSFGLQCPLLDDEAAWPCNVCVEDGFDCELIISPTKKATCEECRRKRRACSYREEGKESAKSCDECASNRDICIAGPAPTAIMERKSYERAQSLDRERETPAPRSYVTCTACRMGKLKCSLKRMKDCAPCASCKEQGIRCTFFALPVTAKSFKKPRIQRLDNSTTQQGPFVIDDIPVNAKTIHTSLCHPITFLVPQENCHWCTNLSFGILGLGLVDVTVVPSSDGLKYKELHGGHQKQGQEPSKMCTDCCMSRIAILNCAEHELRPLDGISTSRDAPSGELPSVNDMDLDDIEVEAAFDRLTSNSVLLTDQWCHLCPSLALFQCCTPQEEDKWGDPLDPMSDEAQGCGLLLCETCAGVLTDEGNLDGVLDRMGEDGSEDLWGMGSRADAEFFSSIDNLLVKNVLEGLGLDEGPTLMEEGWAEDLMAK